MQIPLVHMTQSVLHSFPMPGTISKLWTLLWVRIAVATVIIFTQAETQEQEGEETPEAGDEKVSFILFFILRKEKNYM